ncbi:acetylcholinesterase isoform X2 [Aricia agestis]|nr:acetylcholinesterase isoform X2 [Aricia agestis]XP_041975022.1 acetylcholinesterase isoform X2 [Aricia agestis]
MYFGIPYASPPTGRLRFSPPERHPGWRRTLFAHKMPPRCPGPDEDMNNMSEDCLYLNIWTSRRVDTKLQPVVVILYSESWNRGGISLPCQDLAAEGVVAVTVSYRLNIFGFFTLMSEAARGNLALLDQYMALLWVKENIAAFGGDSNSITLMGHTGGADSVLYHVFSPRSIGLFHRAIIMSPQYTTLWKSLSSNNNDDAILMESVSRTMSDFIGCRNSTDSEILLCMKSLPIGRITEMYSSFNWTDGYHPTSDIFLPQTEQYLPVSLSTALSQTKSQSIQLDVLLGISKLEAIHSYDSDRYVRIKQKNVNMIYEDVRSVIIPELLRMLSLDKTEKMPLLMQAIEWEYFGLDLHKRDNVLRTVQTIAQMETAAKWETGCALLAARLARKISRLYVYRFSDPFAVDLSGRNVSFTDAVHGTDLLALLGDPLMLQVARRRIAQNEKAISNLYREYIISFIKYGSPAPENDWRRYMVGESNIHDICVKDKNKTCDNDDMKKEIAFWLQYLPRLSQNLEPFAKTEKITSEKDDNRFRGGVYAMCGVSAILVLLLFASTLLIHIRRNHRSLDGRAETSYL